MLTELLRVFARGDYMPHGMCLLWEPSLIALHVVSDSLVGLSYLSIPVVMVIFVVRRGDFPLRGVALLFSAFIVSCAATHFMSVLVLWEPLYVLDGMIKALTALASVLTAISLWFLLPRALRMPSAQQLAQANARLTAEIETRRTAQTALAELNALLEEKLGMQASQLQERGDALFSEVERRLSLEAQLTAVITVISDGIIMIDAKGRIEAFNPGAERVFGYGVGDVMGENIKMLMPPPYHDEHDQYLARYMRTGEKAVIGGRRVVMGMRATSGAFPMELSVAEAQVGGEKKFIGVVRDLTEREVTGRTLQMLQDELLHVSRTNTMGQMAAAIAHELNQPLSSIATYLSGVRRLLARDDPSAIPLDRVRAGLAGAIEQSQRAGDIIRHLRGFLTRNATQRSRQDLSQVVEEAVSLALVGSRQEAIDLEYRAAPEAMSPEINRVQIQQVIINLVRNAAEAVQEQVRRQVAVSVDRDPERKAIRVAVSDNGPGISSEIRAKLFMPFVSSKPSGMGLGLSLSREIIRGHGGSLFTQPNPGGGTTFVFELPDE